MKHLIKMRFVTLLLTVSGVVLMLVATMGMVIPARGVATPISSLLAEPTVDLLTTSNFAVLAHTTITNTGLTTINGDVGLDTGSISDVGTLTINGATHVADAVAIQAQTDLVTAYNDAAGRTPTSLGGVELGGRILTPGVYNSGGVLGITGTLTLDAQGDPNGVFIFQSTATLITASGSSVNLINGARFCRIFWVVPSSATLGTNSTFVGHIFALTDIQAQTGATVYGQLLARTGAVTLDNNTITNGPCPTTYNQGILTIFKVDSSGNPIVASTPALSAVFDVYNAANGSLYQEGSTIAGTNFFRVSLPDGAYNVTEKSAPAGYSIDSTVRTVTISGGDASLTFVNGSTGGGASSVTAAETTAAETAAVTATTTVTGGQLPKTDTHLYELLIIGTALMLVGTAVALVSWRVRKQYYK